MSSLDLAVKILASNLQVEAQELSADTELLGNFPEFNSLTIVGVIGAIEDELDCDIDDEEISTELFATVGALAQFIDTKSG